jgi:hypothetical protein
MVLAVCLLRVSPYGKKTDWDYLKTMLGKRKEQDDGENYKARSSLPYVIKMIKWRRFGWVVHAALIKDERGTQSILQNCLGDRCRWEDNIKIGFKETEYKSMDRIQLTRVIHSFIHSSIQVHDHWIWKSSVVYINILHKIGPNIRYITIKVYIQELINRD